MRAYFVNGFSMLLLGLGFVSVIWVTSSLTGLARSQNRTAIAPPGVQQPIQAPSPNLAPPSQQQVSPVTGLEPVADPNAAEILTEEYAPSSTTTEGYSYDPTGRRDPFKPILPEVTQRPGGDVVISTDPLQAFELAQYKVIGIVWDVNNPRAMVKDPQGKLYTLKKETKIGRNSGFVSSIREGAVLVVEPAFGDNGTQTAVTRVMLLTR